jgi:DNA-directed RNA polymerase subunit beta'
MTQKTSQILFNSILPEKYRDYSRNYTDPDTVTDLLTKMASELPPDEYRDVLRDIYKLGADISYLEGVSFKFEDLRIHPEVEEERNKLVGEIQKIVDNPKLDREQRNEKITDTVQKRLGSLNKKLLDLGIKNDSGLAWQVRSRSRGKEGDLQSLLLGDMLMTDEKGELVPFPILHGYAEGVDPAEMWAGAYGTRFGLKSTQECLGESTLVRMGDGTAKEIKDIAAGDEVVGVSLCGKRSTVRVKQLIDQGEQEAYTLYFSQYGNIVAQIECTDNHRIWLAGKVVKVKGLRVGNKVDLFSRSLMKKTKRCKVCLVTKLYRGVIHAYDLEVEHPDHLFMLDNGIVVSNSTADAGYWAKRAKQAAHKQVITMDDCNTNNAVDTVANDPDNVGSVLARDYGKFKAGSIINVNMLKELGDKPIMVRSPLTCDAADGLCAKCTGVRSTGKLPEIGDNVGLPAVQAISERVTQSALSHKHSAGRTSGGKQQFVSGFPLVEQLTNVPRHFRDAAAVSTQDGAIDEIVDAPQGGKYIVINQEKHYVYPNMTPSVKVGDTVEAGDLLSDGIPNPADIIKYKGLGETRRVFIDEFKKATGANRRNVEVFAKGLMDYVKIHDPDLVPNAAPDDIIKYSDLVKKWKPREGHREVSPSSAIGKYLEKPVGHYTIGTKVSRRVANSLKSQGIKSIDIHDDEPPFSAIVVPSVRTLSRAPDWQERMGGYHLKDSLLDAASRGMTSDLQSTSYLPGLMRGTDFAKQLDTTGKY